LLVNGVPHHNDQHQISKDLIALASTYKTQNIQQKTSIIDNKQIQQFPTLVMKTKTKFKNIISNLTEFIFTQK
jgi:hypothetical protein